MNTKLNKSDWLLVVIVYAISITINSFDYYREGNMLKEYLIDFSVSTIISLLLVLFFMYWLIPNYLVKEQQYFKFVFFGLISLFISGAIDYTAGFYSGDRDWAKYPKGFDLFLRFIFRMTDDAGLLLGILLTKKFYEGQTEYLKIEKQQKDNELKLLRSQIDPHFLFNNLNTLDSLIDSDSEKAKEYINRLSLIYRYLIKTKDAEVMELSEELNLAENYMFLIKTRFGNDYSFDILKNASISEKFIPTGSLQTLLENVVKHNKPEKNTTVSAQIFVEDDYIKVVNSKSSSSSKTESFGTGIKNLKMRYKLLSNKEIVIINTDEEFTISIPIIKLVD